MEGYLIDATCGSAERVGRIRRYDISVSEDSKELGELYGWVASHEDAAHQVAREGAMIVSQITLQPTLQSLATEIEAILHGL
jgi:hypothetical protein